MTENNNSFAWVYDEHGGMNYADLDGHFIDKGFGREYWLKGLDYWGERAEKAFDADDYEQAGVYATSWLKKHETVMMNDDGTYSLESCDFEVWGQGDDEVQVDFYGTESATVLVDGSGRLLDTTRKDLGDTFMDIAKACGVNGWEYSHLLNLVDNIANA